MARFPALSLPGAGLGTASVVGKGDSGEHAVLRPGGQECAYLSKWRQDI